jgi:hypothetical protein
LNIKFKLITVIIDYAYITFIGFDSLDPTHFASYEMKKSSIEPNGGQRVFHKKICISQLVA